MPKKSTSGTTQPYGSGTRGEGGQQAGGNAPSAEPPQQASSGGESGGGGSRPSAEPGGEGFGGTSSVAAGSSAPSIKPPTETATGGEGITAWQNNRHITALWSINQNRNSWVYVKEIAAWKKLMDNSDSAIVALTLLSASAMQTQSIVNYREEADGKIYEMYVW